MAGDARTALVVMPDDAERRRVVDLIGAAGHEATTADGTLEALALHRSFDLVVLSIEELDDRDLRFLDLISRLTPHVRVLLLVPEGRRMDALRFMEPPPGDTRPRADAMLGVPFFESELRMLVNSMLRFEAADALTGLPNRPAFELALVREVARADRNKHALALGLLDIDDFKQVNTDLGYTQANHLLREFGRRLRDVLRTEDLLARWGGEEFVALAPLGNAGEPKGQAEVVFERVRAAVQTPPFEVEGQAWDVRFSGGVALFPADVPGFERPPGEYLTDEERVAVGRRLFEIANKRLLCAKQHGKDQIHYEDRCP